ncbi:MAG: Gfo/Idh/MocA family oxidoreductase [Clostridia bacterium]|nr:Gfo/Idh/MocA family oxidoreductase [Clostridia bacterium]
MIRLATIGTSAICDGFLSGMKLTHEYELSAVYSRNADTGKAFADKHGCGRVFTDLAEMARASGIDAVYIASPNVFHAEQTRIFLENGKHVLCEKPIVTSLADYIELKKLADKKGLVYMEAIIPRHSKGYCAVKAALKEIGSIAMARIDFCQRSSRLDAFLRGEQVNIFDMSLHAGTLMDLGVYCVYGAVDLLGMPKEISAECSLMSNGADGAGSAVFKYDGFSALLTYSKTGQSMLGSEIIGEKGTLKIPFISQYCGVTLVKDGLETQITGLLTKAEQMQGEAQRFADYILRFNQNKTDYVSANELCLNVHKCMDQIKNKAGIFYPEK